MRPGFQFSDADLEVFRRDHDGLAQVDTSSDAALILDGFNGLEIMRFRLVYDGPLKAAGNNNPRARDKWALRNVVSPQIAALFATHPVMRGIGITASYREGVSLGENVKTITFPPEVRVEMSQQHAFIRDALSQPVERGGRKFVPLVRDALHLACELDILFLRNDAPGSLVKSGGDLDNRIKTLFDGLRLPSDDEMKVGEPDSDPCYCLLEDDKQISSFAVRTDRLLIGPDRTEHHVLLVIEVKLTVLKLNCKSLDLI
jgi:hypothetical protein